MAKEIAKFVDADTYSLEQSASPTNAHYFRCEEVESSKPYASCLNRLKMIKEGDKLDQSHQCCVSASKRGMCPAINMREKEVAAGRALFYVDRPKLVAFTAERDGYKAVAVERQRWEAPAIKRVEPPEKKRFSAAKQDPQVHAPKSTPVATGGFADAINFVIGNKVPMSPLEFLRSRQTN